MTAPASRMRPARALAAAAACALFAQGCAHGRSAAPPGEREAARGGRSGDAEAGGGATREPPEAPLPPRPSSSGQRGKASYYGASLQGHATASGEPFDLHALTAAHRTLPLGTRVRVTNLSNGRQVVVRINDRGPYAAGRIIDLSEEAARRLGFLEVGLAEVRVERLDRERRGPSR